MMFRWLCALISMSFLNAQETIEQKIQILATANTHAAILPVEPYSLAPANRGWARLATAIKAEKSKSRNIATLIVDCGDTLQGDPIAYIHNNMRPDSPNPIISIMNTMGYQAMVPGAHDFDFGLTHLKTAERQAGFPFIAANVVDSKGLLVFKPFAKTTIEGITVAMLGILVPSATGSLAQTQPGMTVKDALETAREWLPRLRSNEKADIVIVIVHTGSEGTHAVPNDDNTAILLAEKALGIDAVIATQGHQSLSIWHKGVPIVQPAPFGQSFASITFTLQRQGKRWSVRPTNPINITIDPQTPPDPQVLQITGQSRIDEDDYLNTRASQLGADLDGRWSTVEPTPMLQLLHDTQIRATGAQLSATSSPGTHIFIPKGPTSVRQFYALAPHENRVAKIRITGAQLRAYLEHAARYFNYSHLPELLNRNVPLADYDIISGCSYALDISRHPGKRVTNLKFAGNPVSDNQVFTMAISTYRLAGGGGYLDAIGFKGQAEMISRETLRNLLLEYVLARPTLNPSTSDTWRTIPSLDRERVVTSYK